MSVRVLRWAILGLIVIGGLAFLAVGANGPKDPTLRPAEGQGPASGASSANRRPFGDFTEIGFRIDRAGAAAAARCALLAETGAQQGQGLMKRADLGGYDGMLFKFPSDITGEFFMKDTPLPLSIAFFDATGQFVSSADMAPCLNQASCPTYGAARPYRWALEVPQGNLPGLAVGPGAKLTAGGGCT